MVKIWKYLRMHARTHVLDARILRMKVSKLFFGLVSAWICYVSALQHTWLDTRLWVDLQASCVLIAVCINFSRSATRALFPSQGRLSQVTSSPTLAFQISSEKKSTPGVLRLYLRQKPGRIKGASSKIKKNNRWNGVEKMTYLEDLVSFSKSKHFRQLFDCVSMQRWLASQTTQREIPQSSRNHGDFGQETTEQWKQKAACLGYVGDCTLPPVLLGL